MNSTGSGQTDVVGGQRDHGPGLEPPASVGASLDSVDTPALLLDLDANGEAVRAFQQSLFVLTTVMSRAQKGRAVLDAGLKAHSIDSGMPLIANVPGAAYTRASDEHGIVEFDGPGVLALGQKIRLIPGHCDPTVNLYDWLVCVRHGCVEDLWPITARGAIY